MSGEGEMVLDTAARLLLARAAHVVAWVALEDLPDATDWDREALFALRDWAETHLSAELDLAAAEDPSREE